MPVPPSLHAVAAIVLAILAVFLFTRERLPLESSGLFILIVILTWFEMAYIELDGARVAARDVVAAFGNEALITIAALMMLTRGIERTGALLPIGHGLAGLWRVRPRLAFLTTLVTAAGLSMFLNNTPVVAAVLPLLVAVSLKAGVSPSGILMPVGFATIIGGMATTIGTSTNLLITGIAADFGMRELRMFEFAPPVLVVGSVAVLFLWLIAPRMLPARRPPLSGVEPRVFDSQLRIEPGGFAAGRPLSALLARCKGMKVRCIARRELMLVKLPYTIVRAGDRLQVRDTPGNLKEYEALLGATLLASDSNREISAEHPLESDERVAEVVITPGSGMEHKSLDSARLLTMFGLVPLALHRTGVSEANRTDIVGSVTLRAGDVVLVQGSRRGLERLHRSGTLLVLDGELHLPRTNRATVAIVIMIAVVAAAATGLMRISIAAMIGLTSMLVTRCLSWSDAWSALDRRIVIIIVASLALGLALYATGAAEYIAMLYVALTDGLPVAVILSGFILIMALLTEVATNNAIAVLGTPIAISIAAQLGAPPEPFVIGLLYGANMSYIMPVGYQTNLLVMSAGGYRFADFARVGLPLQLIMWLGLSLALFLAYDL